MLLETSLPEVISFGPKRYSIKLCKTDSLYSKTNPKRGLNSTQGQCGMKAWVMSESLETLVLGSGLVIAVMSVSVQKVGRYMKSVGPLISCSFIPRVKI